MGFEVKIRVHTDTLEQALSKRIEKFRKEMLTDDVKLMAAEIYADCVEPLVPMKSGELRSNISFPKYKGTRAVRYDASYAEAQYKGYNGRGPSRNFTTPGTTDHWNHHMTAADRAAYYDLVAEELIARLNNG